MTGHPLRSDSVGGPAGGRTNVPLISETQKEVNGGLIPLLHTPNQILKSEYGEIDESDIQRRFNADTKTHWTAYDSSDGKIETPRQ